MNFKRIFRKIFKDKKDDYVQYKINDIQGQIFTLQTTKMNKVRPIGAKDPLSPEYLINFQEKRIHILEKMNKMKNSEILNLSQNYKNNICYDCQYEFNSHSTMGIPCEKDYEDYCMLVLTSEILNNGTR